MILLPKIKNFQCCLITMSFLLTMLTLLIFYIVKSDTRQTYQTSLSIELNLTNVLSLLEELQTGENIFMIETEESVKSAALTARQACAIESAALTYPDFKIYFLHSSRESSSKLILSEDLQNALNYSNIRMNYVSIEELSAGSPMEEFIESGKLEQSEFQAFQTSDALRLLLMWNFGGIYLDTDIVVRERFDSNISNFACRQSSDEVNTAVYKFETKDGRSYLEHFMRVFMEVFKEDIDEINSSFFITRAILALCNVGSFRETGIIIDKCEEFHILKTEDCYPISWQEWNSLMNEYQSDDVMRRVNQSKVVHCWNQLTKDVKLDVSSKAPYMQLARKFCPRVMQTIRGEF